MTILQNQIPPSHRFSVTHPSSPDNPGPGLHRVWYSGASEAKLHSLFRAVSLVLPECVCACVCECMCVCACACMFIKEVRDRPEGEPVLCYTDQGHCILPAFRKLLKLEPFVTGGPGAASALGGTRIHLLASERNESIHSHTDSTNVY